jgi:uncharacterized protein (DUF2267 family)
MDVGPLTYDEFLDRVAEQAGIDREQARRAADAVFDLLAVRLTEREMRNIEPLVPPEFRPAIERGLARGGRQAVPLSLDAFVERIAKLEAVSKGETTQHARAVFTVLRQSIGDKEWRDIVSRLPDDYRILWKRG